MFERDWLDELRWGAIGLGIVVAIGTQVALTLLVLRNVETLVGWGAVVGVELCIALGAFCAGWRARHAALINALVAALISAACSLAVTAARAPATINLPSIAFLFGTFALMGVIGGGIAMLIQRQRNSVGA